MTFSFANGALMEEDKPVSIATGVVKRIKTFYIAGTASSTTEVVTLSTYMGEVTTTTPISVVSASSSLSTTSTALSTNCLSGVTWGSGSVVAGTTCFVSIQGYVVL
jgi:hypothetical protein